MYNDLANLVGHYNAAFVLIFTPLAAVVGGLFVHYSRKLKNETR